jgi:hypothetical protein
VLLDHLLSSLELLGLLLTLELILHHSRDIVLDLRGHILLHEGELLSFIVQLFGLGDDVLFLSVETVIDVTLLSFFLQESDGLHRSLTLNHEGSDFVHVIVG